MPWDNSGAFWRIATFIRGVIVTAFFFILGENKALLPYWVDSTPV